MNPNSIKKNDRIFVTRDNGEVLLGVATKVGPWSKNPNITVVNYHFKKGDASFTSKADARRCKIAPPEMAPPKAEVHPIMKDWDVGPLRRGPMMMEGYYFHSMLSFCGKRVGKIVDAGNGGPVELEFKDRKIEQKFIDDAKKWALANGGDENDGFEEFWSWMTDERNNNISAEAFFKAKKEEFAKWASQG
jgi:hypothetical protein